MGSRTSTTSIRSTVAACLLATLAASVVTPLTADAVERQAARTTGDEQLSEPPPARERGGLRNGLLRAHVERDRLGQPTDPSVDFGNGRARVEVVHSLRPAEIGDTLRRIGATLLSQAPGIALAIVPQGRLEALENVSGVDEVRPPFPVSIVGDSAAQAMTGSVGGNATARTRADAWHSAGHRGAGVRIGIVDLFDGTSWNKAAGTGDLPAGPAGTFCRSNGVSCNVWSGRSPHGVAVAEVVRDMAPGASLYVASATTVTDLRAAIDWFAANNVRIVTRSLAAYYDGPGNGTGAMANAVSYAVSKGITFFNSAGNSARGTGYAGGYWRGRWSDPDGDRWLNFSGTDELMSVSCGMSLGLRWNDWGTSRTDYDVFLYDASHNLLRKSEGSQGAGAAPLENFTCPAGTAYMAVWLYSSGNGTASDVFEYMVNMGTVEYASNPYSATQPASDTASAGALSVGAMASTSSSAIAPYSSQGPTNDGRIKPDLTATSCISSVSYPYPSCFSGTSAATPVAAGAAALVLGRWPATTPSQMKTWLLTYAVADRGAIGKDNVYGAGELVLP